MHKTRAMHESSVKNNIVKHTNKLTGIAVFRATFSWIKKGTERTVSLHVFNDLCCLKAFFGHTVLWERNRNRNIRVLLSSRGSAYLLFSKYTVVSLYHGLRPILDLIHIIHLKEIKIDLSCHAETNNWTNLVFLKFQPLVPPKQGAQLALWTTMFPLQNTS